MATNLSSTGLEVAKVEQSDIATGGTDKVLLYASGSGSDTRLYVKSGADAQKQLGFDIDQFDALGGTGVAQGDHFIFSDAGTEKKITFSNMEDAIFGNVSGDATVAAGGALTIANDAVEQAMIADDAVGADQLASNAVVEASIVDNAVTLAKMAGITRGSIILGDSSGDPSLLAKGSAAQFLQSDGTDPSYVSISGDATVAAGGALTIGTGVVEHAMLAADCIDGDNIQDDVVNSEHLAAGAIDTEHLADNQVTLAKMAGLASAKFILGDSNGDPAAVTMSGDATMSNTGALTIAAQAVENSMLADDAVGADELAANAVVNASVVDGALKADKLDIDGSTDIGADLADADLMVVDDGAGGTNRKSALSRVKKYIYSAMSGDATASDTGALTIGANAVEGSMLNSNTAGAGLGYASNTLAVQVSGAVAIASDKVGISGSFAGAGLAYSGSASAIGGLSLDIDNLSALGSAALHQTQDHFAFSDNGTEKKITFSNLQDAVFADVSGDATIADGGALTIAAGAVENSMLADDAVGADELAANAVVEASIVDNAVTLAKMAGITRGSIILGDSSGDPSLLAKGSAAQFLQSDGTDPSYVSISGDATVAAGGALTIGTGVVEHAMLAADCIDGDNIQDDVVNSEHLAAGAIDTEHLADNQVTLAKMAGLAAAKFILGDSNGDPAAVTMSGDATLSNAGALTIAANAVEGSMLNSNVAGSGLDYGSNELSVDVSDFMTNGADNRILTATGTDAMNAEANLSFNGSVLVVGGAVSGSSAMEFAGGAIVSGSSTIAVNSGTGLNVGAGGYSSAGVTLGSAGTVQAKGAIVGDTTLSIGGGYSDGGSGLSVSAAGALQFNGALTVGSSGEGVDATFHGGTANEAFMYDASENHIKIQDSSSNTLVTMGGDETSDYGVDVGGGSAGTNNINKVRASAFVTFSDESLKKDIEQMNGALDTVMSLKGVEFTWKNSDARDFGFIAQDVQEILPQAVHESAGVHGVDYSRLTSVLVEAVKAQQVQIEELKAILKK